MGARSMGISLTYAIEGDIDNLLLGAEGEQIADLPQTQQLDISSNTGTDVFGELPPLTVPN